MPVSAQPGLSSHDSQQQLERLRRELAEANQRANAAQRQAGEQRERLQMVQNCQT